jgi:hypothetical protein
MVDMLTPLTDKGVGYTIPALIHTSMLTHQERNAFIILGLVTLTVFAGALVLESVGKADFSTHYTSLSPDGTLVYLEGRVEKISVTKDGENKIVLLNGTNVFLPAPVASVVTIEVDDHVALFGIVQTYRGEKEVLVEQAKDIRFL